MNVMDRWIFLLFTHICSKYSIAKFIGIRTCLERRSVRIDKKINLNIEPTQGILPWILQVYKASAHLKGGMA